MIPLDFTPDATRALAIDQRMNRELGLSLQHVCEASSKQVDFDEGALGKLVSHLLEGGRVSPGTFGLYYDLVEALLESDADRARSLFTALSRAQPLAQGLEIVTLGGAELGAESDRYQRMMNSDPSVDIGFQEPDPEIAEAFKTRLSSGFALLDQILPELAGEIRAIVHQIVISGSDPSKKMQFDGGSHYQLWGALFLNCNYHETNIAIAEVLAHESAHSLLFGFCTHEALVENEDDELFASPLRPDLRPMDGIYHATFVSARMHWAMTQLATAPQLSASDREQAQQAASADVVNFQQGIGVVKEHGRLTKLGAQLIHGAEKYMAAAAV